MRAFDGDFRMQWFTHEMHNAFLLRRRATLTIGRCNSISFELVLGEIRHPIGGPCWGKLGFHLNLQSQRFNGTAHVVMNLLHGWAAAVSWGNDHDDRVVWKQFYISNNSHFTKRDHWNFRICQNVQSIPDVVNNVGLLYL